MYSGVRSITTKIKDYLNALNSLSCFIRVKGRFSILGSEQENNLHGCNMVVSEYDGHTV